MIMEDVKKMLSCINPRRLSESSESYTLDYLDHTKSKYINGI